MECQIDDEEQTKKHERGTRTTSTRFETSVI
jgi:hypothetical protein